jgi:hypothetical protein
MANRPDTIHQPRWALPPRGPGQTKLDRLVDLLNDGTLDGPKARENVAAYKRRIAEIDGRLAAAARTSPTPRCSPPAGNYGSGRRS